MAQLAPNPPTQHLSQLLPTVKCSSCSQPVPLDQLGDHVCPPPSNLSSDTIPVPPPLKVQTAPSPPSPNPPRSPIDMLFPRRRPSANPQDIPSARFRSSPSPAPSRSAPSSTPAPVPPRNGVRSPAPSLNSTAAPSRTQSPFVPPPSSPSSSALRPISRPELAQNVGVPRVGSISSSRSPVPAPSRLDTRSPVLRRPSAPQSPPQSLTPIQRRPSAPQSPPSAASPIQRRPSAPQSPPQSFTPIQRRPSAPPSPFAQAPNHGDPRSAPTSHLNHHPVRNTPSPAPSNYSQSFVSPEFDTKTGGAAGMAGVGRRGFAAVARAAMFATSPISRTNQPMAGLPTPRVPVSSSPQGIDDYRINSPPLSLREPPPAPPMPYSLPTAPPPDSVPLSSRGSRTSSNIPPSPAPAPTVTPPPRERSRPSSIPFPVKSPDPSKPFKGSEPLTPTSPIGLPFTSEELSQKKAVVPGDAIKVVTQDDMNSSFLGRSEDDEESEFGGLAYAQGDDESDDDALLARGMSHVSARVRSPSVSSTYSDDHPQTQRASTETGLDKALAALMQSPTSTNTPLSPTSSTAHIPRASKPPMRSLTSHVQRDPSAQGSVIVRRGATISGAFGGSPDKSRNDRMSRTSQESSASGLVKRREKVLTCIRCSKDIEDKRWISVENGRGVLCDKCWKNMYLPKCRRCNLPIEKQAVSSSDGQLKGKYHRDCFNCHTCHKPFPDKTFYVFDGKPFCDYHYHEANHSLCAALDCGRPIEGPCAVSHTGDRYHLEHLTCEYEDDEDGKRCDERLVDYWEVDGRMFCERHMRRVVERDMMGVELDDVGTSSDARAMKRKTRFIDLAGLR